MATLTPRSLETRTVDHLIDGRDVSSVSGKRFATLNPFTEQKLAEIAEAGPEDVDKAVRSARRAFEKGPWQQTSPWERGRLLWRVAEIIRTRSNELALLDALDCGKPLKDNLHGDLPLCVRIFEYYGGVSDKVRGSVIPGENGFHNFTLREPYGVIACVLPWNYPFLNACIKLAPVLAAGNTAVLKMAEKTPLSTVELGKICLEAGIPPGVVNVVNGGPQVGAALVSHPLIDKISFTGSTATGKAILKAAADRIVPATLELGGKSPSIVFESANREQALAGVLFSAFFNAGQICTTGSRLLVQESIAEEFLQRLIERVMSLRLGDPVSEETDIGPLVDASQLERFHSYVRVGISEGARLLFQYQDSTPKTGYFAAPVIFDSVRPEMRIAQEEIFGPALAVMTFRDEAEAIRLANSVSYGLAASIWTSDLNQAFRMARSVQAGIIWTNTVECWDPSVPYEGHKQSGFGEDFGLEAYYTYTKSKSVFLNTSGNKLAWGR
ncbi:MAG: aldehyde dehydrogenase family protein [Acidobacteria bacterium]|nr:aldehyde dehydrogenase family protein [Acidobacteriota bacterium]MCI0720605.1 aldehyde dehydrogenase family protein [Acidobacteriota bacterium]